MREYNLFVQVKPTVWNCIEGTPVRIEKVTADGKCVVIWEGEASDLGAEIERLRKLVLTPGQFRALATFVLRHGELTNAQGLTALILRNMADEAAEAKGGADV